MNRYKVGASPTGKASAKEFENYINEQLANHPNRGAKYAAFIGHRDGTYLSVFGDEDAWDFYGTETEKPETVYGIIYGPPPAREEETRYTPTPTVVVRTKRDMRPLKAVGIGALFLALVGSLKKMR